MFTTPDEEIRKILSGKPLQQDEESVLTQNVNNDPVGSPNSDPDPFANLSKPSAEVIDEQSRSVLTGGKPDKKMWQEGDAEATKPMDPTMVGEDGGFPNAPEDEIDFPEQQGPPAPDPRSQTPQAKAFEKTAQEYKAPSYKEGGIRRHMPQQYGQKGDPITGQEGPNSPAKTYDLLREEEETQGGMLGGEKVGGNEMMQAKRTLGFGLDHAAIRENYNKYVGESRAKDEEERQARRQRASENRADMAERQASLGQRMNDWQDITGGKPVGTTAGMASRAMGGNAIFGRMRPMTDVEAARARRDNAEADWMQGGRYATEEMKQQARLQGIGDTNQTKRDVAGITTGGKVEVAGMNNASRERIQQHKALADSYLQTLRNAGGLAVAQKNADARRAAAEIYGNATIEAAEIRSKVNEGKQLTLADKVAMNTHLADMAEQLTAKIAEANKPTGWMGGGPADPKNRDKKWDSKKRQIVNELSPGSFDAVASTFVSSIDAMMAADPNYEPPPQIQDLYLKIQQEYNQRQQEQGAPAGQ